MLETLESEVPVWPNSPFALVRLLRTSLATRALPVEVQPVKMQIKIGIPIRAPPRGSLCRSLLARAGLRAQEGRPVYTRCVGSEEQEGRKSAVSLADVARMAGTSLASASRTLNGRVGVKPEIRKRVLAAADELSYTPNVAARNLVMKRAGTIALILCSPEVLLGSQLIKDLLPGLVKSLAGSDYMVTVLIPSDRRNERLMGPENSDGAIVVGQTGNEAILDRLEKQEVPTVLFGRSLSGPDFSYVDVDNVRGAQIATKHLVEVGSREIVMIANSQDSGWAQDRLAGFKGQISESNQLSPVLGHVQAASLSPQGGYYGTIAALQQWPNADAFFVSSETLLPGVLHALSESGKSVPEDISLVTFDDSPELPFTDPPISAVSQPLSEISYMLAELLLETISDPGMRRSILLPVKLTTRASSMA